MFACQGNNGQYDITERKKKLGFGIKKTNQNKTLNKTIIVYVGCGVFRASDSCLSIRNTGSVADG